MPQLLTLDGVLVGTDTYDYASFTASDGKVVPAGTARYVYLATGLDEPPERVKTPEDLFVQAMAAGMLGRLRVRAQPFAKGRRVEYTAVNVETAAPTK